MSSGWGPPRWRRAGWAGPRRGRRPPWWPEGEPWPPSRPPWHVAPRRLRRRLLRLLVVLVVALVGVGFMTGSLLAGGPGLDNVAREPRRRPPLVWVGAIGVASATASAAAALTYRRISQRLAASQHQQRRFLADVTHELRTPLAVLQSGIEAQLDGIHPRDDPHLASLLEETRRLGHLVDDLHTLALADAGRLALHREASPPGPLVDDAVSDHAALAGRKQVSIRAELADGLPAVDVDPTRFRQVLDNLLSNAVRHSPAGGQVRVAVAAVGQQVTVTVTDDGPGFPPERLAHVFDRFTRAADASSSGLGLSIARDLVRAHGGGITANNRPGGGAMVTFTVPIAANGQR